MTGGIANGSVAVEEGSVPLEGFAPRERVSFGFRPEDCTLVPPESSMLKARIFSTEMTGNETIVTCEIGTKHVVVRMDKDFDMQPDEWVGIDIMPDKARLFDFDSGERVHQ
ncbi:TOBE domain-containing protein [Nitratireductor sp. XY-223]|uniref:TOBE domain-containing protein n=1 Tax=Nitratireductor sp. XY-223 TaxID=2561926 RepID=UPI0010AA4965|nr:TOBE domain-containing protein [Nitratireductor sp. XY-223]